MFQGYAAREAGGKLVPHEFEPPELGVLDVEVKVHTCGVCHSDISMVDNEWGMSQYPIVPGHEVIGEISRVGASVTDLRVGQPVGVGWQSGSCLQCHNCRRGREALCTTEAAVDQTIVGRPGGFADHVRCQARWAIPLPEDIDRVSAGPLLCAGTTVWTPMRHFGVTPGMRAAVVGVGGLGHLAVQFLAAMGTEVTGISTSRNKEEQTRELGASHFIATRDTDELEEATGRFDFILSTVSADLPWDQYVAALAPEGRLVICGVPDGAMTVQPFPMIAAERSISGGRAGSPADTSEMLEFCVLHDIRPLIETFSMSEINEAFDRVRSNEVRFRAVLRNEAA